jgi:hypothetical protein
VTGRLPTASSSYARGVGPRHEGDARAERPIDLRLASVHLRTGLLEMSRVELETMAGNGTLDDPALLDLAEVRWRTGDVAGAGEAAEAYLATGESSILALIIAAEAQAAVGRPAEAQRTADRAIEKAGTSLDDLFAGEPRGSMWPPDSTLVPARLTPRTSADVIVDPAAAAASRANGSNGAPRAAAPGGPAELEAARVALAAGDETTAAIQLGIVLRVAPALAPAVLDIVGSRSGPAFDLLRGDAYRLVGHEAEAQHAFATASAAIGSEPARSDAGPTEAGHPAGTAPGTAAASTPEVAVPAREPVAEPPTVQTDHPEGS